MGRSKHPLLVTFLSLPEFPVVKAFSFRLFIPSARCLICCHANNSDFHYYQHCGYKRKVTCPSRVGQVGVNVDLSHIDKRLQELLN